MLEIYNSMILKNYYQLLTIFIKIFFQTNASFKSKQLRAAYKHVHLYLWFLTLIITRYIIFSTKLLTF